MVSCGLWDRYLISLVQSNSVITRWMCQGVIQMDALAIDRGVFLVHSLIHMTSLPLLLCVQYLVPCYDVAPLDYVANMKVGLDWSIIFPSDVYHQHGSDSKFWWERFSGSLTKLCEYTLIQNHTKGTRAWLYRIQKITCLTTSSLDVRYLWSLTTAVTSDRRRRAARPSIVDDGPSAWYVPHRPRTAQAWNKDWRHIR